MLLGCLCLLLVAYDHDQLVVVVAGLLGEDDPGPKLVPHAPDVGALPANQEAVELGLAAYLEGVVRLGLRDNTRAFGVKPLNNIKSASL